MRFPHPLSVSMHRSNRWTETRKNKKYLKRRSVSVLGLPPGIAALDCPHPGHFHWAPRPRLELRVRRQGMPRDPALWGSLVLGASAYRFEHLPLCVASLLPRCYFFFSFFLIDIFQNFVRFVCLGFSLVPDCCLFELCPYAHFSPKYLKSTSESKEYLVFVVLMLLG